MPNNAPIAVRPSIAQGPHPLVTGPRLNVVPVGGGGGSTPTPRPTTGQLWPRGV